MNNQQEFAKIITKISDEKEMLGFLQEICTEKELKDLALRWQLLKELHSGKTQRAISKELHLSLCKITRGSKILSNDDSVIKNILELEQK